MNKAAFLSRLRDGLRGVPRTTGEEIMADYEAHFADAMAEGRSEAEVAHALGDPGRLARELRANAGIQQWEENRNASSAATAVFAILGLGAIDFLILLPILIPVICVIFAIFIAVIAVFFAGVAVFTTGLLGIGDMEPMSAKLRVQGVLLGLGLMGGSVSWGALHTLVCYGLVNLLVWYGRLHMRVLQPAVQN